MKKVAFFVGFTLVLLALAFLPVWDKIYSAFEPKGRQGGTSELSFQSIAGNYSVFLDNKLLGEVEDGKSKDFVKVEPGRHLVKIVRKSDVTNFYHVLERNLDFLPATSVEIAWEAGPTLESSSGTIKYFTQIVNPKGAELYILTFPNDSEVEFDSRKSEGNLFEINDTATHSVKVSNGEGFESKETSVNLTDENTKKILTDLRLVLEVYLYKQPFK